MTGERRERENGESGGTGEGGRTERAGERIGREKG